MWRKPLDADEFNPPKGNVYIIDERCKGCGFCEEFCPRKVLAESERFNSKGYHPPEVVNPDDCVDCELCELICPEFAIFVLDEKEAKKRESKRKSGTKNDSKTKQKKKKTTKKQTNKKEERK